MIGLGHISALISFLRCSIVFQSLRVGLTNVITRAADVTGYSGYGRIVFGMSSIAATHIGLTQLCISETQREW